MLCFLYDLSFGVPSTRILSYNLSSAITKKFWHSLWHWAPLRQSNILTAENYTLWERALLSTFQNLRVSSPAPVNIASPSGDAACEHNNYFMSLYFCRLWVVPFPLRDSRMSETWARMKIIPKWERWEAMGRE